MKNFILSIACDMTYEEYNLSLTFQKIFMIHTGSTK